jgi:Zn-finger nucleic acid-binding protein
MKCPNCDTTLAMSERLGVEIDYCPQCRGVWLDRGEIDRLLESERASAPVAVAAAPAPPPQAQPAYAPPPPHGYDDRGGSDQRGRKRKWSDLLEFD